MGGGQRHLQAAHGAADGHGPPSPPAPAGVKIGTAVLLNALRHPVHLAHAAATIDNISGGRTILGLGAGRGNNQMFVAEHAAVGIPIAERASRMEESIRGHARAVERIACQQRRRILFPWRDVELEPRPVQPSIPLWISSNWVRRGLSRVAEYGDAWITNVPTVELFEQCWDRIAQNAGEVRARPGEHRTLPVRFREPERR